MTTPDGTPSERVTARRIGFEPGDAAVQARPVGGGQFTAGGEARLSGTNQDVSRSGAADAASGLRSQKGNVAMEPAPSPQFTREV